MLAAASCSDEDAGVGLGAADRGDVVEIVDAPATVTAKSAATLTAPADGTLASLNVQPGATVAAGQILAVVDSPSARDRLAQASAALTALSGGGGGGIGRSDLSNVQRRTDEAAAAAFKTARDAAMKIADLEVRAALLVQVQAAERAYTEAATTARALIGSVQRGLSSLGQAMSALTAAQRAQAQAAFDLAKSTVDALTLRAPVAGIVQLGGVSAAGAPSLADLVSGAAAAGGGGLPAGALPTPGAATGPGVDPSVAVGGRVSAGTAVLTVVDIAQLGLMAEVDETDVLLVEPGVTAGVELDAAPGARYEATVTSVDVLPSASARGGVSYRVRLRLGTGKFDGERVAPTPRPGMNAVAHLEVRAIRDAVTVPAAAVFNVDGKDVVWAVRDGKAVRVPVTVGVAGTDVVQIVSGVGDGERIVVRGADRVRAGMELP
jgi:multidrug efflux pump subunit AcrA (membrane-fusion protein)